MKAILVFIDGTICDTRQRNHLFGTDEFNQREWIFTDRPIPGSVECVNELSETYQIVYIGARPFESLPTTEEWLGKMGYPHGPIFLGKTQAERLNLVKGMMENYDFIAGIGDRWDDNELHAEIGCLSIILKEYEGDWKNVPNRIEKYRLKIKARSE